MYHVICQTNAWRIYKDGELHLEGIGGISVAIDICRSQEIELDVFYSFESLKAA